MVKQKHVTDSKELLSFLGTPSDRRARNQRAIELLRKWAEEDEQILRTEGPERLEREWEEFKRAINENRDPDYPVFPDE